MARLLGTSPLSDRHTWKSVCVPTLGFSRLPAILGSFLLSLNLYTISDLNKIYQYSRIIIRLPVYAFSGFYLTSESNNDYDLLTKIYRWESFKIVTRVNVNVVAVELFHRKCLASHVTPKNLLMKIIRGDISHDC